MSRRGLAFAAACSFGASAATAIASCSVDPYLTCGASCVDAASTLDVAMDVAQGDAAPFDAATYDGLPDVPDCGAPACFTQSVPAGWTPVAFGTQSSCPSGFTKTALVSATVGANACTCSGCAASGSWTCGPETIATGGPQCTTNSIDASAGLTCWGLGGGNQNNLELSVTRNGAVTCGTSTPTGTGKATTSTATLCTPTACGDDVCGQGGFTACVYAAGDVACPTGFSNRTLVGTSATVACNDCPVCALGNANAACTMNIATYDKTGCAGTLIQSFTSAMPCTNTQAFQSVHHAPPTPPTPSCGPGAGSVGGTAQLTSPVTICCP